MKKTLLPVIAAFTLFLVGCEYSLKAQETPHQVKPPSIEVVTTQAFTVQPWKTYTTRIEAPEVVSLRSRISGVIASVHFVEGQSVEQGDLLVSLDNRHLVARVEQLKADLASAEAAMQQAVNEHQRATRLILHNAISREQAELREFSARKRRADVSSINARLAQAKLDLSYATIRAPIAGTISRTEITAGNTVSANQSLITTITSGQKRYAYFNMEERAWYRYFRERADAIGAPVMVQLIGEEVFPHRGFIDFVDNAIQASSGTLRIRAVLPDVEGHLLPGAFARVRLAVAEASAKVLVPDSAIATDLENKFVLTVNDNNQAIYSPVSIGERFGNHRVIETGLETGLSVVVNGTAKVSPGMSIAPVEVSMDTRGLQLTLDEQALKEQRTASTVR